MSQNQRYKEIQLPQLRSFCLAATEKNFTTAARSLRLSPSTVWQQVRALERQLHVRLLHRKGRAVELTDDGRLLLELVQPHVNALDSLGRVFESRRAQAPQQLVVASGAYLFAHHLPRPLQEFRASRSDIQLVLRISAWSALQRLIERGEVDVAVLAVDPDVPRSSSLEYEPLFEEPLTLMTPDGHPLNRAKRLCAEQLVKYPLILPPKGGADRKVIERFFRKHDLADRVQTAIVCGLIDVAKEYVLRGMGVALMYVTDAIVRSTPSLHLRVLDAEIERLPIEMAVRKGAVLPEYVQEFRRVIRQCLASGQESGDRSQESGVREGKQD
jgi:DNA-binding transcriptional LysR family regulator